MDVIKKFWKEDGEFVLAMLSMAGILLMMIVAIFMIFPWLQVYSNWVLK